MRTSQKQRHDLRHDGHAWRYWPAGDIAPTGPSFSTLLELLHWPDLPRRRAKADIASLELTPDITFQPNAAVGLYLPQVKTIIYTTRWQIDRQWRVAEILTSLGFADWRFEYGEKTRPYWKGIAKGHARLLTENEPPLLILEDDIEVRTFVANLSVPDRCQIAYLGGGRSGDKLGRIKTAREFPESKPQYGYRYWDESADWFRFGGMWFSHAILYLDKKAMDELAVEWLIRDNAIDTTLARSQWRWRCHCRKIPLFWQNDGHHFRDTYDYEPKPKQ